MSSIIKRLAAELKKLPPNEWTKLDQLRLASEASDTILEEAAEESLPERLGKFDRINVETCGVGHAPFRDMHPAITRRAEQPKPLDGFIFDSQLKKSLS